MTAHADGADRTVIYAIHTPDAGGAPMNETAACEVHLAAYSDTGTDLAANADDRPRQLEYTAVRDPANNDTVCALCGIG
ncbi:MAG: hypothetical protein WAX14_02035 [Rhodococcus sp. (in: high G+C Gram-positive bacteria)]|uniref:hypothetical protein n=1 Tax=Rhodococcus sp. TaxID=1831 RepID=UPI003BB80432